MVRLCCEVEGSSGAAVLDSALQGAMALLETELGNVQIADSGNSRLTIATSSGFGSEFLEYFAVVDDEGSACGRAAQQRAQTVTVDVNEDVRFAPHREIAAASRFRSVQSTPLVCPTGRLHGVISTHSRDRRVWSSVQLQMIALYAERVAASIARVEDVAGGELVSLRPISLDHVMAALLEFDAFGGGSQELIAWELGTSAELVRPLWLQLVRADLIEPAGFDDESIGEAMWRLTDAGRHRTLAAS